MVRRGLGELRWYSGRQHSPPGRRNGHAPLVENGELDKAPQSSDGLSARSERTSVDTEGLGLHTRHHGGNHGALGWSALQRRRDLGVAARIDSDAYNYIACNPPIRAKHQEDI